MDERRPPLLTAVLYAGIAVLYLPMLVLVGYSFNGSQLVNVWGGFSLAWYRELAGNAQILEAARLSLAIGVVASTIAVVLGTLAAIALVRFGRFRGRLLLTGMVNAPLVMPEIITGITQLLLFVSMLHLLSWPHRFLHVLRDDDGAGAPAQRRPVAGRGGDGPRVGPGACVPRYDAADHRTGAGVRLAPVVHAFARRPGDLEFRRRPGIEHAADGDLFEGEAGPQP